jgi:hypothetical protein
LNQIPASCFNTGEPVPFGELIASCNVLPIMGLIRKMS